ncbi:AzlC family ABC transporter permease [Litchfieldella xinjiangensis]|uniref:AzlC family ABC transporter permease n=1 Tax=Litchfieldella xinjiangensis TaxID=1166948 RepID=UPI0005B93D97|nr:AzlC family ABC transporter permease [Halomonas xinjiangensis]
MRAVMQGLLASLSIMAGYIPIAISFGLAAIEAGLSPGLIMLVSVVVYAGASQFVLIALLASGAGLLSAVPTVLMMNARHLFYGPALLTQLRDSQRRLPSPLLAFGLTDEVFATALSKVQHIAPAAREPWFFGLQLGAYGAWLGGTLLGTRLGDTIATAPRFVEASMTFILPALFFALLLDVGMKQWRGTLLATTLATLALLLVLPSHHALALGMLAGALYSLPGGQRCSLGST